MFRPTKRTAATAITVLAVTSLPALAAAAPEADELARAAAAGGSRTLDDTGNMIFFHPDGTDAAYWEAGRIYWDGPDAVSQWDRLPEMTVYRGHMADQFDGTSNGGATVHAFGFKVDGPGSFGTDSGAADVRAGDVDPPRRIDALSGYPGSWLREAGNAGHPIGIINDGDIAEPGTGAFLAEVATRNDPNGIVQQIIQGRPGFEKIDQDAAVVMGGGEENFLPAGTPYCTERQVRRAQRRQQSLPLTCLAHRPAGATLTDDVPDTGGTRTDGLNLLKAATEEGYTVVRTRREFERLRDDVATAIVLSYAVSMPVDSICCQVLCSQVVRTNGHAEPRGVQRVLRGGRPRDPEGPRPVRRRGHLQRRAGGVAHRPRPGRRHRAQGRQGHQPDPVRLRARHPRLPAPERR